MKVKLAPILGLGYVRTTTKLKFNYIYIGNKITHTIVIGFITFTFETKTS